VECINNCIFVIVVVAGISWAITMLLTDRNFNTTFFDLQVVVIRYYISIYFGFLASGGIYFNFARLWNNKPCNFIIGIAPIFGYLGMVYAMVLLGC
jgi:heme/copper-type cytochrome/quinol oxidase subunit 1